MIKFISTADPLLFFFLLSLSLSLLLFFLEQKMVKWMWGEVRCREINRLGSNSPALQSLLFTSIPRQTFFFLVTNQRYIWTAGGKLDYANHLDYADTLE